MALPNKYNAAIIGCGRIASDFDDDPLMRKNYGIATHAGAYVDNPNIELIAAADISELKLNKFGKRWNVSRLYGNYEKMLDKEKIDILSICTPNSTHLEIFEKAVDAGVKAIFCEKPISDSLESADRMVDISRKNDIIFLVNHRRRWDGLYQDVKKYIAGGGIGEIQQVGCYYNAGIANTGCHLFDVLRMLFGEAQTVNAWYKDDPDKSDPNMDGYIIFENNISVVVQSLNIKNYVIFEFDIYGSKGRLRIENNGFKLGYWSADESKRYSGLNELVSREPPVALSEPAMFKNAMQNIVECLSSEAMPACTGIDGVKSLEIICAFHASAMGGNMPIDLPLKRRDVTIKSK